MPIHVVSYSIYHSSNCYLGVILAERALAGLDVAVERRPLCIPKRRGIFVSDLVGGSEGRARSSYNREDCLRWARRYGIELKLVTPEIFAERAETWKRSSFDREELAARAYYAALGSGREAELDRALYRASYVDLLDVNEEEVVRLAARQAGLDDDEVIRAATAPETRARLDHALAEFERDGGPGLPTWVVGGERFWGKDRVDWLAARVRELGG